jgi:predicted RNA-binding Zn-ribbon protein involved in translation (DUF1610 family)
MSISFQCTHCGKKLKAPDNAAGKSSTCPGCGNRVTCPEPVLDAEVVELRQDPEKQSGFDPYADLDPDKPYDVVSPPPAAEPATESRRPCPMCGEMILATAAKCRYCGEVFDPTLKKAKGKKSKKGSLEDETISVAELVLAVLCSGIGCIVGIVWMIQGKPKGLKMFGLSLMMVVVWNIVNVFVQMALQRGVAPGGP